MRIMGQKNQGIFSIEKEFAINRELTMTLMRLITIKYFNRLTALVFINEQFIKKVLLYLNILRITCLFLKP